MVVQLLNRCSVVGNDRYKQSLVYSASISSSAYLQLCRSNLYCIYMSEEETRGMVFEDIPHTNETSCEETHTEPVSHLASKN